MKKILLLLLVSIISLSLFVFTSCGTPETPDEPDTPENPGEPNEPGAPVEVDLSGISFTGVTRSYDGEAHSIYVKGTLPEGVEVVYEGNDKKDAGVYEVVAKFYMNGTHLEGKDLMAKITIKKISYDMSGVSFANATFTKDEAAHSIEVTGTLPEGVEVSYENNGKVEAGKYTVTAKFTGDSVNYEKIEDITATMTIIDTGFGGISFGDKTVYYNGEKQSIEIEGTLPEGVTVEYTGNNTLKLGENTVTAKFVYTGVEYNEVEPITATLTILKGDYATTEGLTYRNYAAGVEITGYTGSDVGIILPDDIGGKSVLSIASYAFENNTSLEYIALGSYVTNIGNKAFAGCTSLDGVYFGNTLKNIGIGAFQNSPLTEIILPDTLEAIQKAAFEGTKAELIKLPFIGGSHLSSNEYFGYIFGADGYVANCKFVPKELKRVIISDACKAIPAYSFVGCSGLEEVVIGSGVASIGTNAFRECTGLSKLYIPKNVTSIPQDSDKYTSPFYLCSEDLTLVLEATDTNFGRYWNCISSSKTAEVITGKTYEEFLGIE